MITSIGAGKTNMAPCVFVWFCNLLAFSKDDAIATFFLALEDLCFSPAACFVKVLCACFHKL